MPITELHRLPCLPCNDKLCEQHLQAECFRQHCGCSHSDARVVRVKVQGASSDNGVAMQATLADVLQECLMPPALFVGETGQVRYQLHEDNPLGDKIKLPVLQADCTACLRDILASYRRPDAAKPYTAVTVNVLYTTDCAVAFPVEVIVDGGQALEAQFPQPLAGCAALSSYEASQRQCYH